MLATGWSSWDGIRMAWVKTRGPLRRNSERAADGNLIIRLAKVVHTPFTKPAICPPISLGAKHDIYTPFYKQTTMTRMKV